MREMNTISPNRMVSLWWSVRWVKGLVLMLIPVGVVDAVYTVEMATQYGPEIEFNPITRWFLANGLWHIWAIINILGYTFFCMLAGSYYLHTRNHPSGPDTFWLSLLISLRIGMTAYNVTFFYIPVIVTVFPPFWAGLFAFCGSLYLMHNLFRRQQDLSWQSTKYFFTSRIDNRYDARLIRAAGGGISQHDDTAGISHKSQLQSVSLNIKEKRTLRNTFWIKRVAYFAGFLLSFVAMSVSINIIAIVSDFSRWQYELPNFNTYTGQIFMGSFIVILFFIGLSMFFLFRAFSYLEEEELPI